MRFITREGDAVRLLPNRRGASSAGASLSRSGMRLTYSPFASEV